MTDITPEMIANQVLQVLQKQKQANNG